jgi:hypothetical protein
LYNSFMPSTSQGYKERNEMSELKMAIQEAKDKALASNTWGKASTATHHVIATKICRQIRNTKTTFQVEVWETATKRKLKKAEWELL